MVEGGNLPSRCNNFVMWYSSAQLNTPDKHHYLEGCLQVKHMINCPGSDWECSRDTYWSYVCKLQIWIPLLGMSRHKSTQLHNFQSITHWPYHSYGHGYPSSWWFEDLWERNESDYDRNKLWQSDLLNQLVLMPINTVEYALLVGIFIGNTYLQYIHKF